MVIKENVKVNEWGEIVSAEQTTLKKVKAEEFCQIYLRDNEEFYKLTKAESNVLAVCWYGSLYYSDEQLECPGNQITLDKKFKDIIKTKTGLAESTIKNSINNLVKKEMLLKDEKYKLTYYLNPKYFFKGRISDRTKLITHTIQYEINKTED